MRMRKKKNRDVRMQRCEGGILLTLNQVPTCVDKVLELELVQR